MKRFLKKTLVALLAMVLFFSTGMHSARAGSLSRRYAGQFVKNWTRTVSYGGAVLKYGFNTEFFNEDTCHAYDNNAKHYAKIRNGTGVHLGPSKAAGSWSKIEVSHGGSGSTYSWEW